MIKEFQLGAVTWSVEVNNENLDEISPVYAPFSAKCMF